LEVKLNIAGQQTPVIQLMAYIYYA